MTDDRPLMTMSADNHRLYIFVPRDKPSVTIPPTIGRHSSAHIIGGGRVDADRRPDGSVIISGIDSDEPFAVVCLTYPQPIRPDLSYRISDNRIEPLYAQSSGDYYSTFRSIVGYRHLLPAETERVELHFDDADMGRSIDINGRMITLQSHKTIQHTTAEALPTGPLVIADAPGLMGRIRPEDMYDWKPMTESWTDPISRTVETKSGVMLRQILTTDRETELPLDISYTEGVMVYLNGEYIDAAPSTPDGGRLRLLLPLRAGANHLLIRLYARFGHECRVRLTPLTSCRRHVMELPLTLLHTEPGKYHILDLKRPYIAPLASPAHLSTVRVHTIGRTKDHIPSNL